MLKIRCGKEELYVLLRVFIDNMDYWGGGGCLMFVLSILMYVIKSL